jgi:hypothetical protein
MKICFVVIQKSLVIFTQNLLRVYDACCHMCNAKRYRKTIPVTYYVDDGKSASEFAASAVET